MPRLIVTSTNYLILLVFLVIITGCAEGEMEVDIKLHTEQASNGASILKFSYSHPNNDEEIEQQFSVVSAYEGVGRYIETMRNDEGANSREVFRREVIIPVWDTCFKDGEYLDLMNPYFNFPEGYEDIDRLERHWQKMSTANLEEIVQEAMIKSAELLPGPDTAVCILPELSTVRAAGINVGAGKIVLFYNLRFPLSEEDVGGVIAHEYHHSVWTDQYYTGQPFYLLKYLIFEGRAEAFKHLVYPNAWEVSYPKTREEDLWNQVKESLMVDAYDPELTVSVMFGGQGFPREYGYALGYEIVKDLLDNHPELTVEEWTAMSPEKILEWSQFEGRFD